jgi:hypothetical protein
MNAATLEVFATIADTMRGESADWQWVGRWESQQMFGITESAAKAKAARFGGEASQMVGEAR